MEEDLEGPTQERPTENYCQRLRKFRGSPATGQAQLTNIPVEDSVTKAVLRSWPPKQILVVMRSGIGTKEGSPSAELSVVMPPSTNVATQTSPFASIARESNI